MPRPAPIAALLANLAAPALAAPGLQTLPVTEIAHHPARFLGQSLATEGWVIDKSDRTAQIGATNQGIIAADTLAVIGPMTRSLTFFSKFRVEGTMTRRADAFSNGSPYALRLTAPPVAIR